MCPNASCCDKRPATEVIQHFQRPLCKSKRYQTYETFLRCLLYIAALGVVFCSRTVSTKVLVQSGSFPVAVLFIWTSNMESAAWSSGRQRCRIWAVFLQISCRQKLKRQTLSDLPRMIQETCVAEWTHGILSIAGLAMLWFWPGIGGICMTAVYILLGNLPFIVVQRFNRPRLQKLLLKQQRNMQIRNLPRYEEQLLTTIAP